MKDLQRQLLDALRPEANRGGDADLLVEIRDRLTEIRDAINDLRLAKGTPPATVRISLVSGANEKVDLPLGVKGIRLQGADLSQTGTLRVRAGATTDGARIADIASDSLDTVEVWLSGIRGCPRADRPATACGTSWTAPAGSWKTLVSSSPLRGRSRPTRRSAPSPSPPRSHRPMRQ